MSRSRDLHTLRLLALLALGFLPACDDEDEGWKSLTLSGLQTADVVIADRTRVSVPASVTFEAGAGLEISGQVEFLMAAGTSFELPAGLDWASSARVVFQPADDAAWQKVRVAQPVVSLHHLTIRGAQIGLDLSGSGQVTLSDVVIRDCDQYGLYSVSQDSLVVSHSTFADSGTDNAHLKFGRIRLHHCTFEGATNNGIYSLDNGLLITDCLFRGNGAAGVTHEGPNSSYSLTHSRFSGNNYGFRDLANQTAEIRFCDFVDSGYFPLQFAHPRADRVVMNQNNILPGPGNRRIELSTTGSYLPGRYLPAMENWWGTTDLAEITAASSFVGDGRHTANSDTIRVEPILTAAVTGVGPR